MWLLKMKGKIKMKKNVVLCQGKSKFIYSYNESAVIIAYITGYKLLDKVKCGFPNTALDKVVNKLENNKISYEVTNGNQTVKCYDFKKLNKFDDKYKKAKKNIDYITRIEIIMDKIKKVDSERIDELLRKLENCFDE